MNREHAVSVKITLAVKVAKTIQQLIEAGDYRHVSDFLNEAARTHLNLYYSKTWEKGRK